MQGVRHRLALTLVALYAGAADAAAVRYNEALPAAPRSGVEARVEAAVAEAARASGREVPRPDPRLQRAMAELVRRLPKDGRPPNDLVQAALWLHGVVEPPPHLIVVAMAPGAEDEMLAELRGQLGRALSQGRYRRVAAAAAAGDEIHVVVALQETALELEPVPRAMPRGGRTPLKGRLLPPYRKPEGFVTGPNGQVTKLHLDGDASRFLGTFHCGPDKGRYQIELTGDDRYGATVLANFPVYCGVPAPTTLAPSVARAESRFTDAASAEARLVELVNADRARAGLPALEVDARLRDVARAHSADMQAHGFVGHVSPVTGSARDRVVKAGIDAQLVAENVARAYTPEEAQRGFMESPGHRANVLSREVTHVGVGVVAQDTTGGGKELLVTQLFLRPGEALSPASRPELRKKIDALRRGRGLGALDADEQLDRIAQATADELAAGKLSTEAAGAPLDRALSKLAGRFRSVRSVVATTSSVQKVVESLTRALLDADAGAVGIGLKKGRRPDGSVALFAVIVLAAKR